MKLNDGTTAAAINVHYLKWKRGGEGECDDTGRRSSDAEKVRTLKPLNVV